MTLVLSRSETDGLLEFEPLANGIRDAFVRHGQGDGLPILRRHLPGRGGGFHVVVGGSQLESAVFTTKVTAFFDRPNGFTALFSAESGELLALVDGAYLTAMRTAAVSLVALSALARSGPLAVLIVGAGRQADYHCRALLASRPAEAIRLRVHARDRERARALAVTHDVAVEEDLPAAVTSADVIITLTSAQGALFPAGSVQPGTTVLALGSDAPGKQELDPELLRRAHVVADVRSQARESGELQHVDEPVANAAVELGEVLAGTAPGRTGDDEIVVFDSTGTAIQDGVAASQLVASARERGLGTTIALHA